MKRFFGLVLSIFIGLSIYSCSDSTTSSEGGSAILPLSKDNYWKLERENSEMSPKFQKYKIGEKINVEGEEYYEFINFMGFSDTTYKDTSFIKEGTDGIYTKYSKESNSGLIFKDPCEENESYEVELEPGDTTKIKCEATDTLITTPSGQFNCVVFAIPDAGGFIRWYLSPGTGFVAMAEGGDTLSLANYQID